MQENIESVIEEAKRSPEWILSQELAKTIKRQFIIIIVLIACWIASVFGVTAGFLWYLNQYEYVNEEITVDSQDGDANYVGNDGNIYNGTNSSTQEKTN